MNITTYNIMYTLLENFGSQSTTFKIAFMAKKVEEGERIGEDVRFFTNKLTRKMSSGTGSSRRKRRPLFS